MTKLRPMKKINLIFLYYHSINLYRRKWAKLGLKAPTNVKLWYVYWKPNIKTHVKFRFDWLNDHCSTGLQSSYN